jgi:hypothetical protein
MAELLDTEPQVGRLLDFANMHQQVEHIVLYINKTFLIFMNVSANGVMDNENYDCLLV